MHPILAGKDRLRLYLLAWVPAAGLLVYLLAAAGDVKWQEAVVVAVPLALVYALVCLSAWYLCRAVPAQAAGRARLLLTNLSAAAVSSALWVLLAKALAQVLARFPSLDRMDERLDRQIPVLFGTGVLIYLLAAAFHYAVLAVDASRRAETREMEARMLARESELKALKAQLNPHFLFNSLHSISALAGVDAGRARDMSVRLADFLRSTLGVGEKQSIPLGEELSLARSYLQVEQVRFGSRLRVEEHIDKNCERCLVPPLLLQPLVENAVKQGIAGLVEGGRIRLEARLAGLALLILLENDFDPDAPPLRAGGLGLANVRMRLQVRYGSAAAFQAGVQDGRYRVQVTLPAETEAEP